MNDNALIKVLREVLLTGLAANGQGSVPVKQAFQPTQQGANTDATVYFFKLEDQRYGFGSRLYQQGDLSEKQLYITTFQIEAWVRQIPQAVVDYSQLTASDLVNLCARILASQAAINTFSTNKIGVLRSTEVRNPYFKDDRGQNEASPSFDIQLTHGDTSTSTVPATSETEFKIYEV